MRKKAERKETAARQLKRDRELVCNTKRTFCGATYLLDAIADKTGLAADLRRCFPADYKRILSIAYFLIMEEDNALDAFSKWALIHEHPYGGDISPQRSSELFQRVEEGAENAFFQLQAERRSCEEYIAYDSTSISSYSELLRQVRYGHNKDHEPLPQLNLLIVFGEQSNLPFYYRKLAGNIPDVKTVDTLVKELGHLGIGRVKLVMDRGFFSKGNIDKLYSKHYKFLMSCNRSAGIVKSAMDRNRDDMEHIDNYDEAEGLFYKTECLDWMHGRHQRGRDVPEHSIKRLYMHLYYSPAREAVDKHSFMQRMLRMRSEILSGGADASAQCQYSKYFKVSKGIGGAIKVAENKEATQEAQLRFGCFALISNDIRDPREALRLYRNRDVVEKSFANWKSRLNCNRLQVSSELALEGKLFVHFVALILLSYIQKKMHDKGLFKNYSTKSMLNELDTIEMIRIPHHRGFIRELLDKQKALYEAMDVAPPDMIR